MALQLDGAFLTILDPHTVLAFLTTTRNPAIMGLRHNEDGVAIDIYAARLRVLHDRFRRGFASGKKNKCGK